MSLLYVIIHVQHKGEAYKVVQLLSLHGHVIKGKSVQNKGLIYTVENSKLETNNHEKSGIGLQNVKRRLDLSYPQKSHLEVIETEKEYKISLTLDIS